MVIVIFRSRVRADADMPAMEAMGSHMYELASQMPGFVGYSEFAGADGEYLTLVHFIDEPSLLMWRNHPEHLRVQEAGRRDFFDSYHIEVCTLTREYAFDQQRGRTPTQSTDGEDSARRLLHSALLDASTCARYASSSSS